MFPDTDFVSPCCKVPEYIRGVYGLLSQEHKDAKRIRNGNYESYPTEYFDMKRT